MSAARTATRDHTAQQDQPSAAPSDNLPVPREREKVGKLIVEFNEYMDARMLTLAEALPPHISVLQFKSVVITALQRKIDVLRCTPQSLWNACILAAQDGLLPDGREGAIVPYGQNAVGKKQADIATWMPMVEGLRKKARNSGLIASWEVNVVYAKDTFKVSLGDSSSIIHEPYFGADERGPVIGAYSIATLTDGTKMRDVMTIREIEKIRSKSRAGNGPWNDPIFFPEMCRKTMARRHYKQLPHSSELDHTIEHDDKMFGLEEQQIEQRQQRRLSSTAAAFDQFAGNTIENNAHEQQQGDHGAETGEVWDEPSDLDDAPAETAKPAGVGKAQVDADKPAAKPAAAKEAPEGNVVAEKAKAEKPAAEVKRDPISSGPEPKHEAADEAAPDAEYDRELDDAPREEKEADWPQGKVPENVDQYRRMHRTWLRNAKDFGPMSKEFSASRGLRASLGFTQEDNDGFRDETKARMKQLGWAG
jgi:recombination protein RecT